MIRTAMAAIKAFRQVKLFSAIAVVVVLILLLPWCASQFEGGTYEPMQEDFDRIRLDHLFVIAELMHEYEEHAGHFPFAESADGKPVAVVIASEEQRKNDDGRVPVMLDLETRAVNGKLPDRPPRIDMRTADELTAELGFVLERKVTLPIDPQKVPVNKPSVYVFTCYRDVFDVSGFLHNDFPFARKLGDFNYRVAIANRANPESGIWTAEKLMVHPKFIEFFSAPFNRSGYELKTTAPHK